MAVLSLVQAHKEDLQFLNSQPAQICGDFCKMACNFLSKGTNQKLYQAASQKLQVDVKQIQSGVEGLAYLFIEAAKNEDEVMLTVCHISEILSKKPDFTWVEPQGQLKFNKDLGLYLDTDWRRIGCFISFYLTIIYTLYKMHYISEEDLKLTLVDLGFSEESAAIICSEYPSQKSALESVLPVAGVQHYQYKDLQWRFEIQVSSKSMKNQIQPRVVLKLELEKCGEVQNHCLQADIPNIIHMNQLVNQALQESRTQHLKRIQRAVT